MSHHRGNSHGNGPGLMDGVSIVDVGVKLGLFALSAGIFYLGSVGALPITFHSATLLSILVGFVLLSLMGTNVQTLELEFRKTEE